MIDRGLRWRSAALWCLLLLAPWPAQADVKGRVRVAATTDTDPWLGQPVQVNLDLETTGFSFGDIHFSLPEVDGGILMQTDSTTIKLSEMRQGESWQILRYPLVLYPRKTGVVTVPPLAIRFNAIAAFGSEPRRFDLRTESLALSVQRPPGMAAGAGGLTTREFSLTWTRTPEEAWLKTGDALQLEVTRRAQGVSAMFFEAIQWPAFAGVSAYPDTPVLEDRVERGALTGERIDRITWVFEQAGQYAFPELDFPWWDPYARQLKQTSVPAFDIEVAAGTVSAKGPARVATGRLPRPLLIAAAVVLLGLAGWMIRRRTRQRRAVRPPSAFDNLIQACAANDAAASYRQLGIWVAEAAGRSPAPTPSQFARQSADHELLGAVMELQHCLLEQATNWRGARLATALRAARVPRKGGGKGPAGYDLPDLNPGSPGATHA